MTDPTEPKGSWTGVIRQMSTSSAVNPMLIASIVAIVFGAPALMFGPEETRLFFAALIFLPLVAFVLQVAIFTIVDRDRLQNDRHVEQKMLIQNQITLKRSGKTVTIDIPPNGALIDNPRATELDA